MKRLLVISYLFCVISMVHADNYAYLVFTNTAGNATVMQVDNLTMTVDGNALQVTNSTDNVRFVLTDLSSMQFSNDPTAIENVLDGDQPVQVFSMSGVSLGTFGSLVEAAQHLHAGAYVISNGKNSQTIVLQ